MKLATRCALITGASQGFGLAVAKAFAAEGAALMLCARNTGPLEAAREEVLRSAPAGARVLVQTADVSKPDEVLRLTQRALADLGGLEILVANAGVYGPKGPVEEVDWKEWESAIAINLFGTVLACREAVSHFKGRGYGKIIVLSGGGATKPLPQLSAYAASKAAVVRFAETLAEEAAPFHVDVNAVAPGALNTRLLDEVLAAGPEKVGREFHAQALKQKQEGGTPLERGAALCVFLASAESDGLTGKLLSAVWDPWPDLAARREELRHSDVYTLRRIVPKDRGMTWGG